MDSKYINRVIDAELADHLSAMGAVLIVGPKWCGKTTTAMQKARSILKMQDPDHTKAYLATAETKPSLLLLGENPRLIDEWQMAPVLWDAVRSEVDARGEEGLFILTGSTTVDRSNIMHSGTGRISRLMMRTMSLYESGESNGQISLQEIFDNRELNIDGIKSQMTIENLIFAACRGGWPSSIGKKNEKAALLIARTYFESICDNDISTVDGIRKDPEKVRALLKSYSRNISTLASNSTILDDVRSNHGDLSQSSMYSYIDSLNKIFVIDEIPSWNPAIRSKTSIRGTNKKSLTDPSIAVAALGLSPQSLMQDLHTFGFIFENLCIRDLKVYSSALDGAVSYYRDRYGLEADCVLKLHDGRYALIEFKLGSREIEIAAEHLLELKELIIKHNNESKSQKIREPDLMIILTGGEMAYTRKDGVKIIPVGCLKN